MTGGIAYRLVNPSQGENIIHDPFVVSSRYRPPDPPLGQGAPQLNLQEWQTCRLLSLPLEMIQEIMNNLFIPDIYSLRQTNSTLKYLVDSLPAFHRLHEPTRDTIQAILRRHASIYFSIGRLYGEFRYLWCRLCGDFGPYLPLFTCTCCCDYCHLMSDWRTVLPLKDAMTLYGLQPKPRVRLPAIWTLPDEYRSGGEEHLCIIHSPTLMVARMDDENRGVEWYRFLAAMINARHQDVVALRLQTHVNWI
ncbi:hypothetical protein AJ80_00229 [Polytolypa hystricis UAMH7299]|uniref:F-box domain-containing protein n=1 Tax=Polytolypa hystricis (strain UAMH7299) TaxID=1447883 RepID=A0A2B7Z2Z2_POLH7|nr:hypothetical protein AJ80_00229 [Polytolypa hystricis UAMH7299]